MNSLHFAYITLGILYLIPWTLIFIKRPELRKAQLFMSVIFAIVGFITDPIYRIDWYKPLTLTASTFSFESLIFGFSSGGFAATVYEAIFPQKIVQLPLSANARNASLYRMFILAGTGLSIFFISFIYFKINSFYATIISAGAVIIMTMIKRPDLLKNAIYSGILFLVSGFAIYWIINLFIPGWVSYIWLLENTPKIILLSLPLDDVMWYFLAGCMIGPLYRYYTGEKYSNKLIIVKND